MSPIRLLPVGKYNKRRFSIEVDSRFRDNDILEIDTARGGESLSPRSVRNATAAAIPSVGGGRTGIGSRHKAATGVVK